jgi:hypothetical protein
LAFWSALLRTITIEATFVPTLLPTIDESGKKSTLKGTLKNTLKGRSNLCKKCTSPAVWDALYKANCSGFPNSWNIVVYYLSISLLTQKYSVSRETSII